MVAERGARAHGGRFAYALVSAAPLQDPSATGIGIIFKAQDRSTIRTVCQALTHTELLAAAYEALRRVLEEALATGVRSLTIYVDPAEVVEQLVADAPVPRELLVTHLKTRGMINQLARVNLVAATSSSFSARMLAQSARPLGARHGADRGSAPARAHAEKQLSLIPEDTPA